MKDIYEFLFKFRCEVSVQVMKTYLGLMLAAIFIERKKKKRIKISENPNETCICFREGFRF